MRASLFRARQMGKDVPPSLSSPPQRTPNAGR